MFKKNLLLLKKYLAMVFFRTYHLFEKCTFLYTMLGWLLLFFFNLGLPLALNTDANGDLLTLNSMYQKITKIPNMTEILLGV